MIFAGQAFVRSRNFHPSTQKETYEARESEWRWAAAFASSQEALIKLAEKARANYLAGQTEPLEPEQL